MERQKGDDGDVALPANASSKCGDIDSRDLVRTHAAAGAEETVPVGGDLRESARSEATIYDLCLELLKLVLSMMDCWEMFRARRVCQSWRLVIDEIVDDCRRERAVRLSRGFAPAPATSLQLVVMARELPKLTQLKAPTAQTNTDLRLVAGACHALEKANLCGFKLSVPALRRLALANASSLRELTLPAGISDEQLEALLEPLKVLELLDLSPPVDSSGKWLRLLPQSLKRLLITGSGMTKPPCLHWFEELNVCVRLATDALLDQLTVLSGRKRSRVTDLSIHESPSVTPEALSRILAAFPKLSTVTLDVAGATSDVALEALHGYRRLYALTLRDPRPVTDIPALTPSEVAAVSRLAATCRKLYILFLTSSPENCQTVLSALLETDLGLTDSGRRRTISLKVPEPVYRELRLPPHGSQISVGCI
ncbi:uncharacterized protein LOC122369231 isoform X2 [Amphibalanus amphitrite]|uniref:uncharacterized protein LOC122369231 isoform X2 n=1 Tax=Amphibalanus amphitrite TaxID=1232801 RepID=UPI001C919DC1|nr:uncharacterized protein LOC122369231 isoform X2 [Amphibalanus amphitrite]XP_043199736.1 uncharacterized protein LOC122369231 isoform X2 [Amphibalanus amphitrite]